MPQSPLAFLQISFSWIPPIKNNLTLLSVYHITILLDSTKWALFLKGSKSTPFKPVEFDGFKIYTLKR